MLNLVALPGKTQLEANAARHAVYVLASLFPFVEASDRELNLNFIVDGSLLQGGEDQTSLDLVSFLEDFLPSLTSSSATSVTVLGEKPHLIVPSDQSPKLANQQRETWVTELGHILKSPVRDRISGAALGQALELAIGQGRKHLTRSTVNRIVFVVQREFQFEALQEHQELFDHLSSMQIVNEGQIGFALDVYSFDHSALSGQCIELAEYGGGRYRHVSAASKLVPSLLVDARRLRQSILDRCELEVTLGEGVELRSAQEVANEIANLHIKSNTSLVACLSLGELLPRSLTAILLEFVAPERKAGVFNLAKLRCKAELCDSSAQNYCEEALIGVDYVPTLVKSGTAYSVLRSVDFCACVKMFDQAQRHLLKNDVERGQRLLRSCAASLARVGERALQSRVERLCEKIAPTVAHSVVKGSAVTHSGTYLRADQALNDTWKAERYVDRFCALAADMRKLSLNRTVETQKRS